MAKKKTGAGEEKKKKTQPKAANKEQDKKGKENTTANDINNQEADEIIDAPETGSGSATETEPKPDNNGVKEDDPLVKLAEAQERYLRLSAEFDNYRKRTLKERIDLTKTAGESLLVSLLPVMDDFDRAMNVMEKAEDCKAMKDGIDLIYNKFREFFKQNGVKEIKAINTVFDTDIHEAITKIPAPDKKKKGKVVDVIQKGYYLNDKIMRFSKVVIGE